MILGDILRWLTKTKKCKDLSALRRYIKKGDVVHLGHWVVQSIVYTKDKTIDDEWLSPDETLKRGEGDCEDMAGVCFAVLSSWGADGWKPQLVRLESYTNGGPKAHAVCVFERPDGMRGVLDNGNLRLFTAERKTAWAFIFTKLGWDKAFWVDVKGNKLNVVGWEVKP